MHVEHSRLIRGLLVVLLFSFLAIPLNAAAQPARRSGWAELSALAPATPIVVVLTDGRQLERYFAATTADELVTVDLSAITSSDRREEVLAMLRKSPQATAASLDVEQAGQRTPVAQRFDRDTIRLVAMPKPLPFRKMNRTLGALLTRALPCPNCDAVQTWVGRKDTVLPSPLPARRTDDSPTGDVIYLAPAAAVNPLDDVAWGQVQRLLPAGLRR
jgi:hypothetical protein